MKRIVVTGGLGFLGTHLVKRLKERGDEILILDPAYKQAKGFSSWKDAPPSQDYMGGLTGVIGVVENPAMAEALIGWAPDQIYHLGAMASPVAYRAAPLESLTAASVGIHNLCEVSRVTGARLLLASTSEVYGDPQLTPQREDYRGNVDPVGPRSMYDEGKRYSEAYVAAFHRSKVGPAPRIARIFNTYGPGMGRNDGRMIPEFIRALIEGRPIPVHGRGNQTRTLCYVDDMISGLVSLMESMDSELEERVTPVNLGGNEELTVTAIARRVAEAFQKIAGKNERARLTFIPQPDPQDPSRRCPDTSRARKILGWRPTTAMSYGMARAIEHELRAEQRGS